MNTLFWVVSFFYLVVMFGAIIISIFKKDDNLEDKEKPSIISMYDYGNLK